jgi:hypothetical protein
MSTEEKVINNQDGIPKYEPIVDVYIHYEDGVEIVHDVKLRNVGQMNEASNLMTLTDAKGIIYIFNMDTITKVMMVPIQYKEEKDGEQKEASDQKQED